MSGEGPESVPTSADPRSRRPVKKRALSPVSAQAATVSALFAHPDQEIRLPPAGGPPLGGRPLPPPPEIVTNVQGSSAGAGSGEFHVYKAARRREYERLRAMEQEMAREKGEEAFERSRAEKLARDEERTRRNREKREKMKARKGKGKQKGQGAGGAAGGGGGGIKARADGGSSGAAATAAAAGDAGAADESMGAPGLATPAGDAEGLIIQEDD